ncbi:hypothetical protein D3C72_1791240 [compost metagenome]
MKSIAFSRASIKYFVGFKTENPPLYDSSCSITNLSPSSNSFLSFKKYILLNQTSEVSNIPINPFKFV